MEKGRLIALVIAICVLASPRAYATNHAGLVVKHGNGDVITRCVAFEESSISSVELLERSGLSVDVSDLALGTIVYGIDGEGTAADWNSGTYFWSFWHQSNSGWSYAVTGAGGSRVYNGNVDGWQWMSQSGQKVATLPAISFDEIYQSTASSDEQGAGSSGDQSGASDPQGTNSNSNADSVIPSEARNPEKDNTQPGVKDQTGKKSKTMNSTDNKNEMNDGEQKKSKNSGLVNYLVFGLIIGGLTSFIGYLGFRRKYDK